MVQQIEQACLAMERAADAGTRDAADAFLQTFRATSRPYALCTFLLQGSFVSHAQFSALDTIKIAVQREGRVLGGAFLEELKNTLLNCLVTRAGTGTWTKLIMNECVHVVAILYKMICLDEDEVRLKAEKQQHKKFDERPAFIAMANYVASLLQRGQAAVQPGAPSAPSAMFFSILALELSKALTAEFTQGTAHSNAGVSVSMHIRCHAAFEQHVLLNLATLVLTQCLPATLQSLTALSSSGASSASSSSSLIDLLHVLHSLLDFLDNLLQFEFSDEKHPERLAMKWALGSTASV
ncbi:MAG: hypothetical protein Q7T57_06390, partial [Dehalococcoidales bacterium]|nr:hypothetical protein [Dehalococcoidales bacterium]